MWICICSEIRNMQFSVTRFIDRYQWWKYLNIENSAMIVLWKQDCIHPAFVIVVKISILICWNISSNLIIKICMNNNHIMIKRIVIISSMTKLNMSRWYLFLLSYISAAKLTFIFHVLCGYLKIKDTKTCSWCPQNRFCQQKGNKRSNNFRTRTKDLIIENANEATKRIKNVLLRKYFLRSIIVNLNMGA